MFLVNIIISSAKQGDATTNVHSLLKTNVHENARGTETIFQGRVLRYLGIRDHACIYLV
jgi:hypothetical protein